MNNDKAAESRLEGIVHMLTEFSKGNFEIREDVTEEEDPLNTVVSGLNMLGEELDNNKKEINRQRDFLQNILSSIDEVVYARTILRDDPMQSPYTFISARSKEIIGYSPEELEKEPDSWINSMHPEDRERSKEVLRTLTDGRDIVAVYRIYHRIKKQYRWIEDRVIPKRNSEGIVTEIYGSARDITEEKEVTLELEEKSRLISRLMSSSDQVFYIISLDPGDPFKNTFTYLSHQVEDVIGYTIEDIRSNPYAWLGAIHPDDVERVKADTKTMFSTKKPVTRVYRMKNARTGEYVWLEDYVVPITNEIGLIQEFYASARDITARKTVEIEREKLITELNNRHVELMQFNNIVSHNLRSPVASILGLAQFLDKNMPAEEFEITAGYLVKAAESMDELLHDLNTILSARSTLSEKVEPFLLSEVINSACFNLKKEIDETGTKIHVHIAPDAERISSIKSYIQSAMFNLILNAIKYRSASRTPDITITSSRVDGRVSIAVADNGVGIDVAAHRHRLFALYGRLPSDKEGKGLGLYMTKTQIESLNGTLTVDSKVGEGSTFTITL